jgi:NADH dehydrogenase FAD-containing subunit
MARNVVVAGGGFAGLYTVRALERMLPPYSAKITIVSESNSSSTRRCCRPSRAAR